MFAVWRVNALDTFRFDTATLGAANSDLPSVVAALVGGGALVKLGLPLLIAAIFAIWALGSHDFRASREMIVGGVIIGAVIVGVRPTPAVPGRRGKFPRAAVRASKRLRWARGG